MNMKGWKLVHRQIQKKTTEEKNPNKKTKKQYKKDIDRIISKKI